jgi:hypothetical protein
MSVFHDLQRMTDDAPPLLPAQDLWTNPLPVEVTTHAHEARDGETVGDVHAHAVRERERLARTSPLEDGTLRARLAGMGVDGAVRAIAHAERIRG